MALPGGATGFTLTGGPYDDPSFQGMQGVLTMSAPITHIATGERLRRTWNFSVDYSGNFSVGPLPFTDDPAFTPNGFTYSLAWQTPSYKDSPGNVSAFAVPLGSATDGVVDFDKLAPATGGGVAVPVLVSTVNGKQGIVTLSASDVGADPTGAAAAAQSFAIQRGNHTGSQAASTITGLANVATSGAYSDLSGKPSIPPALPSQTGNSGKYLTTDGTVPSWGAITGAGSTLTPTATKTATYTAAVGDLAMMNVSGGATVLNLPAAPADKSQVGYRAIGATSAVPLTVNRGGSDTIGTTGATSATVPLADETLVYQYDAPNSRWLTISNVKTKASLDAIYALPSRTGNAGKFLTTDGIGTSWAAVPVIKALRKASDQTVNNSAALIDDTALAFDIAAGESWILDAWLIYGGDGTADIQVTVNGPAGASGAFTSGGPLTNVATSPGAMSYGTGNLTAGLDVAMVWGSPGITGSTPRTAALHIRGVVANGTTAGTVKIRWAQAVATAANTTVMAGSTLLAIKADAPLA
jgi:hypothetical protein